MKSFKLFLVTSAFAAAAGVAHAGPILISGTDSDDHGYASGSTNQAGWKFLEQGIKSIGANVSNGQNTAVCLGCNGLRAQSAFESGFNGAALAGWNSVSLTSIVDITNFFSGTGAVNVNNAGMIYMPTVANNVDGGITDAQLGVVNANGAKVNSYLSGGGGLFTQEQANSQVGYGWLTSLLPGFQVHGDNDTGVADASYLEMTSAGTAQFPGLTNADFSNATPWHAYFKGNFGALQVLVTGNGDGVPNGTNINNDAVVLGGGFSGGGGTIIDVPEPESLALVSLALLCALVARPKRRTTV